MTEDYSTSGINMFEKASDSFAKRIEIELLFEIAGYKKHREAYSVERQCPCCGQAKLEVRYRMVFDPEIERRIETMLNEENK